MTKHLATGRAFPAAVPEFARRAFAVVAVAVVLLAASTSFAKTASSVSSASLEVPPRPDPVSSSVWGFSNVTAAAGFNYTHGYVGGASTFARQYAGGVAAGDYNRDGFVDLYVVRGSIGPNLLFRNRGNGTFEEVGAAAGVNVTNSLGCGPAFGDYDGDGWLDLIVGGIETTEPTLFRNLGNGTFQNVTATCGISYSLDTYSCTFADYDRDGALDVFLTHCGAVQFTPGHLWHNNGNGTFTSADIAAGFVEFGPFLNEYTFTANFADMNGDAWPDLLLASDFGTSEFYTNDGDGTFTNATTAVISDENGMGAAIGDYDEDGDLDWFVSSIWDPNSGPNKSGGTTGNRLYRNQGDGTFQCATDASGVRNGYWGWGASFQDFNNDGHLDLYHVNGFGPAPYDIDPARMFVSNGDATFTEMSAALGVANIAMGRGIACFDYDRDGDLDIFQANNSQGPLFYRNNGGNSGNWLTIKLRGNTLNTEAIGARVAVVAGGATQIREIRGGSNYVSQDPAEAHFGLGSATIVDSVKVRWPGGATTAYTNIPVNHYWVINRSGVTSVPSGEGGPGDGAGVTLVGSAPNPFLAETAIRFRIGADARVVVRVFDPAGRHVRTLLDEATPRGTHTVTWNGRGAAGDRVPPGNYFYRIEAGSATATGKISVVR